MQLNNNRKFKLDILLILKLNLKLVLQVHFKKWYGKKLFEYVDY